MAKLKLPRLAYNWLSAAGALMSLITGLAIVLLLVLNITANITNPYLGILIYIILPPILGFAFILIPIGMYKQWRHEQKVGEISVLKWPHIDLNQPSQRNITIVFIIATVVFIIISSVGLYQAYHFSESVSFCGTTCHKVMEPENVAYQNSPHARVECTACHVGPGAGWYTKSKLSGAYQVYAVLANKYPRPIPTPIKNLRPAQETCEQCHWPEKFFGAQQRQFNHYMYDSTSTHWPINILIKTGGGDPKTGQTSGIHWHMNIGMQIEYIARDEKRQDIPWVRVTDKRTGRVSVYQDETGPLSEEEIKNGTIRKMDCMDCHNRPSHVYHSPDYAIDNAILTGKIDETIPNIKKIAVETMAKEYESEEEAVGKIAGSITDYYRLNFPEKYPSMSVNLDASIVGIEEAYSQNIFPFMKVRWSEYPNNIGHFNYKGCMRCHLGNHKNADGVKITHECNTCHTILSQGSGARAEMATSQTGLEFKHPDESIGEAWKETGCYECHSGVQP